MNQTENEQSLQKNQIADSVQGNNTGAPHATYHGTGELNQPPKQPKGKGLPLWLIVLAFVVNPILGVFAVLYHLILTGKVGGQKNSDDYMKAIMDEKKQEQGKKPGAQAVKPAEYQVPKRLEQVSALNVALVLVGTFCLIGGVGTFNEAISWIAANGEVIASELENLLTGLSFGAGGAAMIWAALHNRKNRKIRCKLAKIIGSSSEASVKQVAGAAGLSMEETRKQLEACVDQGIFGGQAYLDRRTDTLFTTRLDGNLKEQPEEEKSTKEDAKEAKSEYQKILDELQQLNESIPGEEMSRKIRRLSDLTAKIFKAAEEDPSLLPKLRRFMDYYLPTALKLLKSYAQLDAQGVEGENITDAKNKIESAMDNLCTAFESQLDDLFAGSALDISSDITVMENMLKADGLSAPDFRLPKENE